MKPLFADTGYWIAVLDSSDTLHARAVELSRRYRRRRTVTSEMVLTEILNDFSARGEHRRIAAVTFVRGLIAEQAVEIVPQTPELFTSALDLYAERPDKEWSLTDCASFVICAEQGITEALAHDHHFEQAGLVALLRESS